MVRTSSLLQVHAPATVLLGVCLLVACGKETSQEPVSAQPRVVTGAVVKGPLQNATVKFFNIDAAGNATTLVSTVATDAQGQFTTSLPAQSVPLLAVTFDGSYVDESDPETGSGRRRITLPASPTPGLEAVLPANATSIAITPYSNAMLLKARTQAGGGNFFNVFDAVQLQVTTAFGFDPFTTIPQDPLNPNFDTASFESIQYAMLLGASAQAINAIAVSLGHLPAYADVMAFIFDLADGQMNSQKDGSPVLVSGQQIPTVVLDDQIRRFRNNNFGLYGGFDVPVVDETLLSQPATVPNTPPTITAIADQVINEDSATASLAFTVGDAETPVGSLLLTDSSSDTAIVSNSGGIDFIGAGGGNFTVMVTPEPDASGVVDITITVTDADGGTAVETFQVTVNAVNDAPVAVDDTGGTNEDIPLSITAATLTANDTDVDGPSLSVVAVSNPVNGSVNLAGDTVTFTPSGNFNGAASFEYTVSDGASPTPATDIGVVTIAVSAVNDAPVANNDAISLNEGGSASTLVGGASSVLANDTDVEGDTLTATVVSGPANALVFLLNPDGNFTYTHDGSETTTDSFTYEADDGNGGTAQATVAINITPVNDPPVAVDDAYVTDEDTPLTIAAPGVLSNDTDPDSSISVNGFSPTTANGAVSSSGDGSFTYTPTTSDFNGTDSFTYTAFDGTDTSAPATVTITINSVNDAPVAGNDTYSGTQGGTIATIAGIDGLLLNDTDVDNTPADLSVTTTPVTPPAHGLLTLNSDGSFSYTHDGSANLVDSFDYEVCDLQPLCVTGTADITLSPAAALLPYLSGSGDLELLDPTLPLDASNPQNLDMGLPIGDAFEHETFFTATVSGSNASDIRPARLVYIKNGIVRKVNLERGAGSFSDPLSTITDACRINGSAEDIPNPDNTILRIDTAGTDGVCGTADDNTAPAYLVRLGGDASTVPFQIGVGQCCGNAGITNSSGALIEVLTTEGTGGSTFALNRRSATDYSLIATVATLQISGTGPTYSSYPRGLGDQHIYLRMRRDSDANFKLFRYNVAGSTLTELYDYGVPDSTGFTGFLDESPYDASNLYFVDGAKILAVAHDATSPVTVPLVTAPALVSRLDQTATFLVYEAHDFVAGTGGVFSFPKAGGSAIPLATDDAAPTFAFLHSVDRNRVYVSMQSVSAVISYTARVVNADDSTGASAVNTADAQWAGEVRETTIDLLNDFDTGIQAQAIFLRTDAPASTATLKIVDPLTGALSGSTLGTVSEVMPGASVFGFGFGRFAQVTAFKATEHTDLYLGDTQTDNTGPLLFVEGIPSADDIWLLGDGEGNGGQPSGPPVLFNWSLESLHSDGTTQGDADSIKPVLSGDGRFVVYQSRASTLVSPSPTLGVSQIYRTELATGATELISADSFQNPGSADSTDPAVSHDGRFIAFRTSAPELVGIAPPQVVLFDSANPGSFRLVSDECGDGCEFDSTSGRISISTDGRFVTFIGRGRPGDTTQVWRAETLASFPEPVAVSVDADTTEHCGTAAGLPDACYSATMSDDGRWIAWSTPNDTVAGDINGLSDVLLRDMTNGALYVVSAPGGVTLNGVSAQPYISADGRRLAFESSAALTPGDSNGVGDIFIYEIGAQTLARANTGPNGEQSTAGGIGVNEFEDEFGAPILSGDGRYLLFNADLGDLASPVSPPSATVSPYLKLLENVQASGDYAGDIVRGYLSPTEVPFDAFAFGTTLSFGGDLVAMYTGATNVLPSDVNGFQDVFSAPHPQFQPDFVTDSDGDGMSNVTEQSFGTNPLRPDSDGDGLTDQQEVFGHFTDPLRSDTDVDDVGDLIEVEAGSDPLNGNTVIRVSGFVGSDSNDGSAWSGTPPTGPLLSNAATVARLDVLAGGSYPSDPLNMFFVLYEGSPPFGSVLDLTGATPRRFVTFVGSVGPGISVPKDPPNTIFNSGGSGSVVVVSNGTDITLRNFEITGGNSGVGGGVLLDNADGPTSLTLYRTFVHDNVATDGGGAAATGLAQLTVKNSQFSTNTASAPSIGGRGGAIYAGDGTLDIFNSRFLSNQASNLGAPSPTNGGGGVYAEGASAVVRIKDSLFADNSANAGPGGGVNLIDIATMAIENSRFLSNQSTRPGGGLHIHQNALPSNPTHIFNNLFVGNATTDPTTEGGAIEIEHAQGVLRINGNTVAYNQMVNDATTGVGGGVSISPVNGTEFGNNIVWFNDNATVGGAPESGDNFFAGGPLAVAPAGNNVNDALAQGNAGGMPLDPLFTQGFYLAQAGNASVDGGDGGATGAGTLLSAPFTTDVTGATDGSPVDIGFHHQAAAAGAFNAVSLQTGSVDLCVGPQSVIFIPIFANAPNGEAGHLIVVEASLPAGISMSSLTTLDPRASGSRIARDLGDGRYAVTIGGGLANASGSFTIYADEQPTPQGFVVTITSPC